jgi:hypothetical protein
VNSAAGTPTAVRRELSDARVTYGATIVDPEVQSASVHLYLGDLQVAIVLGYAEAGEPTVAAVEALLGQLFDYALEGLD